MATNFTIARPYAKAAFQLAQAQQQYQEWTTFLDLLATIVQAQQVYEVLVTPTITQSAKLELLISIAPQIFVAQYMQFAQILLAANRVLLAPEIAQLYSKYRAQAQATIAVTVTTALPINSQDQQMLQQVLHNYFKKTVQITWQEDPGLIGGVIVHAEDLVFDGSMRGQLQALHKQLTSL